MAHSSPTGTVRALTHASASDANLRSALLDALGEAVVGTDGRGRVVYWNAAAERLFDRTAEEVLGRNLLDMAPQGVLERAREILESVRAGREWSGEFLVQDGAGRAFPVLITTTALRDAGDVVGFVTVARDVSAQRAEAEEALHASEERRLLAARATNDVIWDADLKSGRIHWNEAVQTTFRYVAGEVSDTLDWWRERVHPADRARVLDGLDRALDGNGHFWSDEYRFLRGDGTYAAVFDRGYIARDLHGRPVRAVGSMVDLTEQHRAEEAQRFLAQASMLLDLSLDTDISLRNVARLAVTTLADYCLVLLQQGGRRLRVVAHAHADPRHEVVLAEVQEHFTLPLDADSALARVVRSGGAMLVREASATFDAQIATPAGLDPPPRALRSCSHIVAPMIARDRTLGAIVLVSAGSGFHYDAHELRLAEELGRRAGLAVENARLFESAVLADRAKSDFLAIVSHELRTPLMAVLGYVDLLDRENGLDERQGTQVRRIRESAERLLQLIDGILSFTRQDTGREPVQATRIAVAELLAGVAAIAQPMAMEKGIGFTVDAPSDTAIETDTAKARHVLLNLLSNAIKFTERGQVTLDVRCSDDEVVFRVRDTGIGIPPEHVQRVFAPFWQAEQADTRRSGGAGLGLSLARRIARVLAGDVCIAASGPGGTTVEFRLPTHLPPATR